MNEAMVIKCEAVFPKSEMATGYAEVISGSGYWATDVVCKGRKVTWTKTVPADAQCSRHETMQDTLENVGYYGSTQNRKATVSFDGGSPHRAPMSY